MSEAILLVEDDENDAFFMQHAMKKAGIVNPVRVASDGQQAIDYFKSALKVGSNGEFPLPCLVLLDLKLPYVMGLDVLKWIRLQPELAPIVLILSASSDPVDIATAYYRGANGYLVKPSDSRQLDDMVDSIKAFWLTHNTAPSQPNLERVVAELAQRCRQQVSAVPDEVNCGDFVESLLANTLRDQGIQPSQGQATLASSVHDPIEQRIIDTLKTSPQAGPYRPSPMTESL